MIFVVLTLTSCKQKLEFILSDATDPGTALSKKTLSAEELSQQLERLLLADMASDEQIFDWVEVWSGPHRVLKGSYSQIYITCVEFGHF